MTERARWTPRGLAGAVRRLGDPRPALRPDHVVPAVELRGQRLGGGVTLGRLRCGSLLCRADVRADVAFAGAELVDDLSVIGFRRVDLLPGRVGVAGQLADFLFAITNQLAKLLELALGRVRLALGPRARELLSRMVELLVHVANVLDKLATSLVHRRERRSIAGELVFELRDSRLEPVERRSLLRQRVLYFLQFSIDLRELLERANLVGDAQCVTPGR
jgi:hypothetical protein